jgi:hypothetical protein
LIFPVCGGDYRNPGNPGNGCFPFIQGMPDLKKLTLIYGRMGIQGFEYLHSKAPALESLMLSEVSLDIGDLPDNIVPPISVTSFNMDILCICDERNQSKWYTYMARKYTSLINFYCNNIELQDVNSEEAMLLYRDGLIPIYKTLGTHLWSITAVTIPHELYLFNQLDQFGCQIEYCSLDHNESTPIFTQLGQSNQAQYVINLNLRNTMVTLPSLFQNMTSLTELAIDADFDYAYWPINLNEYLNAFPPTLIHFDANCTDLEATNVPIRSTNIRRLHITCPKLPKILGQVVSTCFPKLIELDLRGQVSETISFDLPNCHFQKISLHIESETYPNCFSFKYTNAPQVVYYFDENNESGRIIDPATAEEFQNITNVEFKYASSTKLWLSSEEFDDDSS